MTPSIQLVPTGFGLAAVLSWGSSDFLGGFASRRANAYFLTAISHAGGLLLAFTLALGAHAAFPPMASASWAMLGGACGGAALSLFYGALAGGQMGLTAAVAKAPAIRSAESRTLGSKASKPKTFAEFFFGRSTIAIRFQVASCRRQTGRA